VLFQSSRTRRACCGEHADARNASPRPGPGLRKPACPIVSNTAAYYSKFRELARFLRVDAEVHAAKGDFRDAARSALDAMAMGAQIPHGSTLIGGLVGSRARQQDENLYGVP